MAHLARSLVLVACAPLLLLAGCSDSSPTVPLAPEGAALSQRPGTLDLSELATFDAMPSAAVSWAKAWIGPEGGRLELAGFAVEVPAGAVDRPTQFSIRLPADPQDAQKVIAHFGPHNASFAVPVTIELPYAGTSAFGEEATIVWATPGGEWEELPTTLSEDGQRLVATTTHFSLYGAWRSGGLLASGG